MSATIPHLSDRARLEAIVSWMNRAADFLCHEVEASRETSNNKGSDTPTDQRVERIAFISAELDDLVEGFRCAADQLRMLSTSPPVPPEWPQVNRRNQASRRRLRVIDGGAAGR